MSSCVITEALYYRAYHSFLLQKPEFSIDYAMLREQALAYPDTFKSLSQNDYRRIKKMQDSFKAGRFILFDEGLSIDPDSTALPDIKDKVTHKELCEEIYRNKEETLIPYTGGPIDFACFEYPVLFGSIDITVEANQCAYVIEVKSDKTDHAIIGQVMKYFIGLSLKLPLKFYDDVKIITICPSYEPAAYNGLRQIGALPLFINPKTFKVSEKP